MSPLILTALAGLAATIGIGWIGAHTSRPVETPRRGEPSGRSLAIISIAFCEGIAVLGIVAGLLAIFMDGPVARIDETLAAALPIGGAVLGVVLIVRDRATTDRLVAIFAAAFVLGLGTLGLVVSILGTIITTDRTDMGSSWLYVVLGLAQLVAIGGLAVTSASSIRSMRGVDLVAARTILDRQILRSAMFELVGVGAFAFALLLLVFGAGPPGTRFNATLSNPNGEFPLPVALVDQTGIVVGTEAAQPDQKNFRDAGVLSDPTSPNAFILTWLGGMCDNDAALVFKRTDSGYDVRVEVHEKLGLGCPAAGISRGLRIETSAPIPVGVVTVSGERTIQLIIDEDCGPLAKAATDDAKVACGAFIEATIGDRTDAFANVTVVPADGACPGSECSTAEGIAAQPWRVDATDRQGQTHAWRCSYHGSRGRDGRTAIRANATTGGVTGRATPRRGGPGPVWCRSIR